MKNQPLPRIDENLELQEKLLPFCRLKKGEIWEDKSGKFRVGCLDIASRSDVRNLMNGEKATLSIQDPPYNFIAFQEAQVSEFIDWCKIWTENINSILSENSSFYVWLGADQRNGFQPLPDFMLMMRETDFRPRSFITMRNQRGFGTHKNWMAVRQELLYYIKGNAIFNVEAEYTDIPKILRGYYKEVNGKKTENFERSKSENIRAGNVWVDIQQVFYRMDENVNGCYAQKPLKCIERIVQASSNENDLVVDFFSHSGTTAIASAKLNRRCFTMDIDPIFCEITIRRIEKFLETGKLGWQNGNPFEVESNENIELQEFLGDKFVEEKSLQATLF
jgi:DNA modification methylase